MKPSEDLERYERVVFLGDYLDPYPDERISVDDAIETFKDIINLKKHNMEKVILLLGNHDMPYFSKRYFSLSRYHCRHSNLRHNEISDMFSENRELFKVAHCEGDVLFTHAGCLDGWLREASLECDTAKGIEEELNKMLDTDNGIEALFMTSYLRGGYDMFGSCIWADIREFAKNDSEFPLKQVFGHTVQAYIKRDGSIVFGDMVSGDNFFMLDTANAYELDVEKFEVKAV